jgi:hypothetical protein
MIMFMRQKNIYHDYVHETKEILIMITFMSQNKYLSLLCSWDKINIYHDYVHETKKYLSWLCSWDKINIYHDYVNETKNIDHDYVH